MEPRTLSVCSVGTAGVFVDDTGTTWNIEGFAVDGPDVGATLEYVTSFVTEWYGWAAYHPDPGIYGA